MESSPDELARRFPELDAAFKELRVEMLEAIAASATGMKEQREELYYTLRAIGEARSKMIAHIDNRNMKNAATLAKSGEATA